MNIEPIFVSRISRQQSSSPFQSTTNNDDNSEPHDYEYRVQVEVQESRTAYDLDQEMNQSDDDNDEYSNRNRSSNRIQKLIEKCTISGMNTIHCRRRNHHDMISINQNNLESSNRSRNKGTKIWEITSELSMQLSIPIPKSNFFILPPGFKSVGSRIVKRTCEKRSKETLEELKEEYINWSSSRRRDTKH